MAATRNFNTICESEQQPSGKEENKDRKVKAPPGADLWLSVAKSALEGVDTTKKVRPPPEDYRPPQEVGGYERFMQADNDAGSAEAWANWNTASQEYENSEAEERDPEAEVDFWRNAARSAVAAVDTGDKKKKDSRRTKRTSRAKGFSYDEDEAEKQEAKLAQYTGGSEEESQAWKSWGSSNEKWEAQEIQERDAQKEKDFWKSAAKSLTQSTAPAGREGDKGAEKKEGDVNTWRAAAGEVLKKVEFVEQVYRHEEGFKKMEDEGTEEAKEGWSSWFTVRQAIEEGTAVSDEDERDENYWRKLAERWVGSEDDVQEDVKDAIEDDQVHQQVNKQVEEEEEAAAEKIMADLQSKTSDGLLKPKRSEPKRKDFAALAESYAVPLSDDETEEEKQRREMMRRYFQFRAKNDAPAIQSGPSLRNLKQETDMWRSVAKDVVKDAAPKTQATEQPQPSDTDMWRSVAKHVVKDASPKIEATEQPQASDTDMWRSVAKDVVKDVLPKPVDTPPTASAAEEPQRAEQVEGKKDSGAGMWRAAARELAESLPQEAARTKDEDTGAKDWSQLAKSFVPNTAPSTLQPKRIPVRTEPIGSGAPTPSLGTGDVPAKTANIQGIKVEVVARSDPQDPSAAAADSSPNQWRSMAASLAPNANGAATAPGTAGKSDGQSQDGGKAVQPKRIPRREVPLSTAPAPKVTVNYEHVPYAVNFEDPNALSGSSSGWQSAGFSPSVPTEQSFPREADRWMGAARDIAAAVDTTPDPLYFSPEGVSPASFSPSLAPKTVPRRSDSDPAWGDVASFVLSDPSVQRAVAAASDSDLQTGSAGGAFQPPSFARPMDVPAAVPVPTATGTLSPETLRALHNFSVPKTDVGAPVTSSDFLQKGSDHVPAATNNHDRGNRSGVPPELIAAAAIATGLVALLAIMAPQLTP